MTFQTITLEGKRYIVVPADEFDAIQKRSGDAPDNLPTFPEPDEHGNFPAVEYARVSIARNIIIERRRLGWSQAELARRSGVRVETLNRIEKCRNSGDPKTIEKIDRALRKAMDPAAHKRVG